MLLAAITQGPWSMVSITNQCPISMSFEFIFVTNNAIFAYWKNSGRLIASSETRLKTPTIFPFAQIPLVATSGDRNRKRQSESAWYHQKTCVQLFSYLHLLFHTQNGLTFTLLEYHISADARKIAERRSTLECLVEVISFEQHQIIMIIIMLFVIMHSLTVGRIFRFFVSTPANAMHSHSLRWN